MSAIFSSLIQGDMGGDHGNFEAVIRVGNDLLHYWRDNTNDIRIWKISRNPVCTGNVAGAGSIIRSDFTHGRHGNFEVVVPLYINGDRVQLWHFFHDNSDVENPWVRSPHPVTSEQDQVLGPASLIQSDFIRSGHGNFELVVPLLGTNGHAELWHFYHDNADVDNPWTKVRRITGEGDDVAFPGSIIQSDFKAGNHGNFEVIVPIIGPHGHAELWHFYHDNANVSSEWIKVQRITSEWDQVAGPGVIIQSDFGDGDNHNFEVVVPIKMPNGHIELWHFFHDTDVTSQWRRGQMITASAGGWACIIRSDYGSGEHGNFEVLVEECKQSIVHYWHNNERVEDPWLRGGVILDGSRLTGEQPINWLNTTRKIVQLTGEFDRENWDGQDTPLFAHNQTESRFGIRGTDLGVSFEHKERIYFLFGDTWRVSQSREDVNLDSIAFCTDRHPDDGLDLTFHKQPPLAQDSAFSQREFEVPLDGISFGGRMFVFFSTDHYKVADASLMGRSVVTSSDNDGYDFTYLYEFSREKFINVSIDLIQGEDIGLPEYRKTLLIWGSGRYRSSDVYLAAMPLDEIDSGRFIRYYAGQRDDNPIWSYNEFESAPLFCSGCVGELSVRWNPFVERWLIFYNSDNPRGIIMRSAKKPWGKWSGPVLAFDPWRNGGYGRFMHIPWDLSGQTKDFTHDIMFKSSPEQVWGGEYGPYQIAPLAKGERGHYTQIYFTLSTWNPYQVILMTTTFYLEKDA